MPRAEFRAWNGSGVIDPVARFQELQGDHEVWMIRSDRPNPRTIYSIGIEDHDDLDRVLHVLSEVNAGRAIPKRP